MQVRLPRFSLVVDLFVIFSPAERADFNLVYPRLPVIVSSEPIRL